METRWTLIRGAADGESLDRREFAHRYGPLIRDWLTARWVASPLRGQVDDAMQEVFLAVFKPGGPLLSAEPSWPGGFRAYLYGVIRNIARGFERSYVRGKEKPAGSLFRIREIEAREPELAKRFDRAWAGAVLEQAAMLQLARAAGRTRALRRIELLELRFQDDLPIRDIAARWDVDTAWLHHEYATARKEFQEALRDVLRVNGTESAACLDEECRRVLRALE